MRKFLSDHPTLRGFLIIAAIVGLIILLNLRTTLTSLLIIARIVFILAIAFFVYLLWRERRQEIEVWPTRAKVAFYGAAAIIAVDVVLWSLWGASGLHAAAFLLTLILCGWSMFRIWRDQRTYGY